MRLYTRHTHNDKAAMMRDEQPLMNAARAPEAPPEQEDLAVPACYCQGGTLPQGQRLSQQEASSPGPGSSNVAAFNPAENPALVQGLAEFMERAGNLTQEQRVWQQEVLLASMRMAAASPSSSSSSSSASSDSAGYQGD